VIVSPVSICTHSERTFARGEVSLVAQRTEILGDPVAFKVLPGDPAQATLVAIHGLGSDLTDLTDLAGRSGAPSVLLDLPGFGRSEGGDRDYSVRRAAEVVLGLLDLLEIARPVWLGCSYGGHVALRAALDAPERVRALALICPGGLDRCPPPGLEVAFSESVLSARTVSQVAMACEALVGRPNDATRAFVSRRLSAHARGEAGYRAIARSALGALADDAPRHLERIDMPVELICGARDLLVTPAVSRAAAGRLPRARLTLLESVGHLPWLEAPHRVATRVRHLTLQQDCQ